MAQEIKMSAAGLKAMQEELEYLKTVRRKELAEEIKEARSHGDLSENSEYDEAKNTQGLVENRITEREQTIKNAVIIDESELSVDNVSVGTHVTIRETGEDEAEEYDIVGRTEADAFNGNRTFHGDIAGQLGRRRDTKLYVLLECGALAHFPNAVHVAAHQMPAESVRQPQGLFKIDLIARAFAAQTGAGEGFWRDVGFEAIGPQRNGRQAGPGHRDAVAQGDVAGVEVGRDDREAYGVALLHQGLDAP